MPLLYMNCLRWYYTYSQTDHQITQLSMYVLCFHVTTEKDTDSESWFVSEHHMTDEPQKTNNLESKKFQFLCKKKGALFGNVESVFI
jgi:hypothetical protein